MAMKMVLAGVLATAAAQLGTAAPPAPMITNNAPGIIYGATFDGTQGANITGYVTISANANGTGTVMNVNLDNLPNQANGPFLYHIHQFRVPEDGNCTATGGHLDPENRGETPACDSTDKASCQVGDLAGKYGKMSASPWQVVYTDLFTSTTPGAAAFVGNRSIVIHDLNTTRIACVNIHQMGAGVGNSVTPNNDSGCGAGNSTGSAAASSLAPFPTAYGGQGGSGGSAQPTGGAAVSSVAAGSYGGGESSAAGVASPTGVATGTPVAPMSSATIEASNGAGRVGLAGGAVVLAAAAFLL